LTYFRLVEGVLALLLIVAGVALWSLPAALVVAGVLLTADRLTDTDGSRR
jgi:cytochrome c-type biogenesis protein CcmH/NrfF